MRNRAARALECALAIQQEFHEAKIGRGIELSVKIGVGCGEVTILHIGGVGNRIEYIPCGDPLMQAFECEGHCVGGNNPTAKFCRKTSFQAFFVAKTVIRPNAILRIRLNSGWAK